jgi:hypothetical protein
MLDRIRTMPGSVLDQKTYHEQMGTETERLTGITWKLERSQFFTEDDDDPAWQAFLSGDWGRSLTVFESGRVGRRRRAGTRVRAVSSAVCGSSSARCRPTCSGSCTR